MPSITSESWERRRDAILADISNEANRKTVLRYLDERQASGKKPGTLGNDANALRGLCEHLGPKRLDDATRADLVAYVNSASRERKWRSVRRDGESTVKLRKVKLGPRTLGIRKVMIRSFYKWLRDSDEYPDEVKALKGSVKNEDSILTDELVSRSDLRALLQARPDAQAKAILAVLYDGGFRAGELCALNVGNVNFDEFGAVIMLPKGATGLKTGARRVRLFESVPYLHAWFENHPRKNEPRAALFYSNSRRAPQARMTNGALWDFCVGAGEDAKLKIHTNPHLFRHSCATEKARLGWTEGQMRAYFGWSRSSTMPSYYVHLAGKDYEDMELERRGLLRPEDRRGPALAGIECRVCGQENLATAMFCKNCRNPVSPEAEDVLRKKRDEEIHDKVISIVDQVLKGRVPLEAPPPPSFKGKAKTSS